MIDLELMDKALAQIRNIMIQTHNGIEDFGFQTQESAITNINQRLANAKIIRGIIAALSLIVGGVGIMNIMLASINERIPRDRHLQGHGSHRPSRVRADHHGEP